MVIILELALWLLIFFDGGINAMNAFSWTMCIIMMGILPLCLFVWCLLTVTNTIEFTERGVSRIRFGKTIRHFNWEEVQTISSTEGGSFAGWIYISNKEKSYDYQHVGKMRFDKEVIYFHQSKKALQALLIYAPERFKANIEQYS